MTRWTAIPLRQVGRAWPGIDVKGGKLDNGSGQLVQDSINVTINKLDSLEKRKGIVRGLFERFGTVVCGLHSYTDNCGNEWLVVASNAGITVRSPGVILPFTIDDSYPSDGFDDVGGLSQTNWRNTALYTATGSALLRASGSSAAPFDAASYLRWFKDAAAKSYQVQVEYQFTPAVVGKQVVSIAIKGNGDLLSGAFLQADLEFTDGGAYLAKLYHVTAARSRLQLGQIIVSGSVSNPGGFLTLSYQQDYSTALPTFIAAVDVVPIGGALQQVAGSTLTEVADRDLGQVSAIGCNANVAILVVSGESL